MLQRNMAVSSFTPAPILMVFRASEKAKVNLFCPLKLCKQQTGAWEVAFEEKLLAQSGARPLLWSLDVRQVACISTAGCDQERVNGGGDTASCAVILICTRSTPGSVCVVVSDA